MKAKRSQILIAVMLGLAAFGTGAGARRWWPGEAVPTVSTSGSPRARPTPTPERSARNPPLLPEGESAPLSITDLLTLDPPSRLRAVVDHLHGLDRDQLRALATHLLSDRSQEEPLLTFLTFTRWGELDYEAALSLVDDHPGTGFRKYLESGRAAVDLPQVARRPLTGTRRAGLEILLEQLPPELALRIAKQCFHPDEKLMATLSAAATDAQAPSRGDLEHRDPARWASRLESEKEKRNGAMPWTWESEALALARAWGKTDPNAARTWIRTETTGDLQTRALRTVDLEAAFSQIDPTHDPEGSLDALSEVLNHSLDSLEKPPDRYLHLIQNWLETDQAAALEWLHRNGTKNVLDVISLPGSLADGLRIVDGLPAGALHATLSRRMTERWAAEHPDEAFAWLRENSLQAEPPPEEGDPFRDPFAPDEDEDELSSSNPFYAAQRHNERMSELFHAALDCEIDSAMVAAARSDNAEWIHDVVSARLLHDPRETIAWLDTLNTDWETVSAGWEEALRTWTREAPAEVATWLGESADSPRRDLGISALVRDLTTDGPGQDYAAALAWAQTASERPWVEPGRREPDHEALSARAEHLRRVLRSWAYDLESEAERNEARAAFRGVANSFDERTRFELEQLFNPDKGGFLP